MVENVQETCRTCLLVQDDLVHMMSIATYTSPRKTYADILWDLAKIEIIEEHERDMPQYLCSICMRQLRQMYMFVEQIKECNGKLSKRFAIQSEIQVVEVHQEMKGKVNIKKERYVNEHEHGDNSIKRGYDAVSRTSLKPNFLEVTLEIPNSAGEVEDTRFDGVIECEDIPANLDISYAFDVLEIYTDSGEKQEGVDEGDETIERDDDLSTSSSVANPKNSEFPIPELGETLSDANSDNEVLSSFKTVPPGNTSCPMRKKVLSSREKLLKNRIQHNEEVENKKKFFTCVYCSRQYADKYNLKIHLIYKHQIDYKNNNKKEQYTVENNKIKCKLCDYTARTHAAFHFHKRSKHGTEDDRVKCKFCSYSSLKKFDLLLHIKKSHLTAIKTLKRNLGTGGETSTAEIKQSANPDGIDSIKDFSDFVHKLQETNDESNEDPIDNSPEEYNEHEVCSSGDEELIRDILNIKKRLPKSKTSRASVVQCEPEAALSDGVTDSPKNAAIAVAASCKDDLENTSCPLCDKVLVRADLLTHMLMEHREECSTGHVDDSKADGPTDQVYACNHCPIKFNNKYRLRNHLLDKHHTLFKDTKTKPKYTIENKVIRCRLCEYTTKTHAGLHYHTRSKHGTEDDKFKCNFCSYTCFKKFDLLHHTKRTHLAIVKTIKRDIGKTKDAAETSSLEIGSTTEDITSLVQKFQDATNVDTTESNLEVSSGDEDTIRDILNMKKRLQKTGTSSSFARRCEECGNVYKNSVALNVHRRMVHGEHVYSQCPHCERKYKRPYDLKIHILGKHTPANVSAKPVRKQEREKRFMCTQCSYICTTSTCLTIHTHRHHTGEKPYQCEFCSKAFVVKADLKTHRYLHTGERPFKCSICLKGFRDKNHMHRHKRTHSDIKPYNCQDCGKGFSKNYNLSIHKRTHMKGQKLRCLVCGKYFKDRALLNVHQISENHHEEVV